MFYRYWHSISKVFRDIEAQMYLGHGFDLSRSRDVIGHVMIQFPHGPFSIGVQFVLTLYLERISRYWGWHVSRSRFWPFRSRDVIGHVVILSAVCFLRRVSIACYAEHCISYCYSIRLSVSLSHAGTVSKRLQLWSCGLHWRITQWL